MSLRGAEAASEAWRAATKQSRGWRQRDCFVVRRTAHAPSGGLPRNDTVGRRDCFASLRSLAMTRQGGGIASFPSMGRNGAGGTSLPRGIRVKHYKDACDGRWGYGIASLSAVRRMRRLADFLAMTRWGDGIASLPAVARNDTVGGVCNARLGGCVQRRGGGAGLLRHPPCGGFPRNDTGDRTCSQ